MPDKSCENYNEPKFIVGDVVWIMYEEFVHTKIPCPACKSKDGKVLLRDGKWYDCPNCNLMEEDRDGFDIRIPENAGWVILDDGKYQWFKLKCRIEIVKPARRLNRDSNIYDHSYITHWGSMIKESDAFSSEAEVDKGIQERNKAIV